MEKDSNYELVYNTTMTLNDTCVDLLRSENIDIDYIKTMFRLGANCFEKCLHKSCQNNNIELARATIEANGSLHWPSGFILSCLDFLGKNGRYEIMKLIIDGCHYDETTFDFLLIFFRFHPDALNFLMNNTKGGINTWLSYVCKYKDTHLIDNITLYAGINAPTNYNEELVIANDNGYSGVVEALINLKKKLEV
jgi:hypothetical protein